ncbi:oligosaccharide flippase family protein [Stakelama tenebrarum]|uniref:Oligosaccharide flippase family protein n=1 Tax=Stakelama tenebrarum TaxID=2711215 RepID=A0A6G6Y3P8_9SPHN|nr:oligosaccharide flippase family protein [Sphingosinithalassobacter tenebrarum]QIG79519.1 oligosaccharide flippase family protein [Sphingosinithalassobacter tenebrarum]
MFKVIGRSAVAIVLTQGTNFLFPLVALPFISRALGVEGFGLYTVALAFGNYLLLFSDFTFNVNGPLHAAEAVRKQALSRLAINSIILKTLILAPATVVCAIALRETTGGSVDYIFAAIITAMMTAYTPRWMMYSLDKIGLFLIFSIVSKATWLFLVIVLVTGPEDISLLLLLTAATQAITAVGSLIYVFSLRSGQARGSFGDAIALFRSDFDQYLAILGVSSLRDMPVIILSAFFAPAAIALYGLADRVRFALLSVVAPVTQSLFLLSSRLSARDGEGVPQHVRGITNIGLIACVSVASLACAALAPLIVDILGGAEFASAVSMLRIIVFIPIFTAINSSLGVNTLLANGHKRAYARTQLVAVAFSVPTLLALIYFQGTIGAAFGGLLAEALMSCFLALQCRRHKLLGYAFALR